MCWSSVRLRSVSVSHPSLGCCEDSQAAAVRESTKQTVGKQLAAILLVLHALPYKATIVGLTISSTGTPVAPCPVYLAVLLRCYGF